MSSLTWPARPRPRWWPSACPGSRCCSTGGCASVTTGSATGCRWPSLDANLRDHLDRAYPGGESWRQAVARVGRFLDYLVLRWNGQRVLVIGHVATRWALDHFLGGVPLEDLMAERFAWQEGWQTGASVVSMHPESARLTFGEMTPDDLDDMTLLLGDPEVMTYYPRPKTRDEAVGWIEWNRGLYGTHGYGLWLLNTADDGFVGDCGRPLPTAGGWRDRTGGRLPRAARAAGPRLRHRGGGRLARLRPRRARRDPADRVHDEELNEYDNTI